MINIISLYLSIKYYLQISGKTMEMNFGMASLLVCILQIEMHAESHKTPIYLRLHENPMALFFFLSFNLLSLFIFGKQGEQYIHTYLYQYIQTCLCAQASIALPLYDSHAAPSLFPSSQIYEQLWSDYYCTLPQLPSPNTFCHHTVFCNRTLICS